MIEQPAAPTGLARRRRRLSDQETRDRMLRTARELVQRTGLTVSLEHISFEDVIRGAGVARSTAYRHWPHKDLFFGDLVKDLARTASPQILQDEIELIHQILARHQDHLLTPSQRHRLLLELFRDLTRLDFEAVLHSPDWRTYIALQATCSSLADGDLRAHVRAALIEAEAEHTARVAQAWRQLTVLFGYRLRPELGEGFDTLATLLTATLRGLVVTALSDPRIATHTTVGRAFGDDDDHDWSLMALGMGSIAMTFIEPDPADEWDDARLEQIRRLLDSWADSPGSGEPTHRDG